MKKQKIPTDKFQKNTKCKERMQIDGSKDLRKKKENNENLFLNRQFSYIITLYDKKVIMKKR